MYGHHICIQRACEAWEYQTKHITSWTRMRAQRLIFYMVNAMIYTKPFSLSASLQGFNNLVLCQTYKIEEPVRE
jgi:hypothetical protein